MNLLRALIAATTMPGDLVVDPAAGSFVVMHAALSLGRDFIGCDLAYNGGAQ
jgi:site-specific DNA-methyltransferase (adenine-specific)